MPFRRILILVNIFSLITSLTFMQAKERIRLLAWETNTTWSRNTDNLDICSHDYSKAGTPCILTSNYHTHDVDIPCSLNQTVPICHDYTKTRGSCRNKSHQRLSEFIWTRGRGYASYVDVPGHCLLGNYRRVHLWVKNNDCSTVVTKFHSDTVDKVISVVTGKKLWCFISPMDYLKGSFDSQWSQCRGYSESDLTPADFIGMGVDVRCYQFKAGDQFFLPGTWPHYVLSNCFSLQIEVREEGIVPRFLEGTADHEKSQLQNSTRICV